MNLTKNFTLEELTASSVAQSNGINNIPDEKQILNLRRLCREILQPVREKLGKPIIVTSGFRSPALNRRVGGVATSQHLEGAAADIISQDNSELWRMLCLMVRNGEIAVGQLINEKGLRWIQVSLPDKRMRNQVFSLS